MTAGFELQHGRRTWQRALLLLAGCGLLLVSAASGLQAQGVRPSPKVSASVSPERIRPGGYALFSITVEGGTAHEVEEPTLPQGVDLVSSVKSTSSGTTIINGRISRSYTQSWQITAVQPGEFTIPPQELRVNGQLMKSNSVSFQVTDDPASPAGQFDPLMSIELEKREFYVGEQVPISANVYVHRQTVLRRVGLIEIPKDNFAIQRFPLQAEEGMTRMGGVPYRVLTYRSTLSALKPGRFKIGPATSEIIIEVPSADNPFPHPFFSQAEPRKLRPPSNEIEVDVKPLPAEGKPKGFKGVVGDFEMHVTADPTSLTVGEPVAVEITITGSGNFDAIGAPALSEAAAWKVYPAKRFEMGAQDPITGGETNRLGFSQVIIPQKVVKEVPPFEFSFFSPTKKQYVVLRSPAIPLQVQPGVVELQTRPEQSGSASQPGPPQPEKAPQAVTKITDILTLIPAEATWLQDAPPPWQNRTFLLVNGAAAAFLSVLLLGKGVSVWWQRSTQAADATARHLWKQLRGTPAEAAEFYAIAARYIREKRLQGPEMEGILKKNEEHNYSPQQVEKTQPLTDAERSEVLELLRRAGNRI